MNQNRLLIPNTAAVPRTFLVCWDAMLHNEATGENGTMPGDVFISTFRMNQEQVLQVKKDVMAHVAQSLPEGGPKPVGVIIRQIVEMEQ